MPSSRIHTSRTAVNHASKRLNRVLHGRLNSPGFDVALKALEDSVTAFQNAARSGEKATIDATRKGLRPPYSRMFLRFG